MREFSETIQAREREREQNRRRERERERRCCAPEAALTLNTPSRYTADGPLPPSRTNTNLGFLAISDAPEICSYVHTTLKNIYIYIYICTYLNKCFGTYLHHIFFLTTLLFETDFI